MRSKFSCVSSSHDMWERAQLGGNIVCGFFQLEQATFRDFPPILFDQLRKTMKTCIFVSEDTVAGREHFRPELAPYKQLITITIYNLPDALCRQIPVWSNSLQAHHDETVEDGDHAEGYSEPETERIPDESAAGVDPEAYDGPLHCARHLAEVFDGPAVQDDGEHKDEGEDPDDDAGQTGDRWCPVGYRPEGVAYGEVAIGAEYSQSVDAREPIDGRQHEEYLK